MEQNHSLELFYNSFKCRRVTREFSHFLSRNPKMHYHVFSTVTADFSKIMGQSRMNYFNRNEM